MVEFSPFINSFLGGFVLVISVAGVLAIAFEFFIGISKYRKQQKLQNAEKKLLEQKEKEENKKLEEEYKELKKHFK
jgi:F0F1-type ATP synthase epsilon subunit